MTGMTPWRTFIERLLLWLGSALIAFGCLFFLAFNWDALSRYAHFALVDAAIVAALLTVMRTGAEKPAGRALLFVLAILTGALLALIGQTYQTGADTFELFAAWAALILPWVLLARSAALWLFWLLLVNVALLLWFGVSPRVFGLLFAGADVGWALFLLNGISLLVWELMAASKVAWMQSRWPARAVALAAGAPIMLLALSRVLDGNSMVAATLLAWALSLLAAVFFYTRHVRDVFMPAAAALSFIVVIATVVARSFDSDAAGFLVTGLVVIALSAAAARWLRSLVAEQFVTGAFASVPTMDESGAAAAMPALTDMQRPGGTHDAPAPWFVRAMLGVAGWLGALFLLAFVGVGLRFVVDSAVASLVVGALCCSAAAFLFRVWPRSDFAAQFALAVSLAGQALLLLAFDRWWSPDVVAVASAVFISQVLLFLLMSHRMHRVWSAWAALSALVFVVGQLQALVIAPALLALVVACCWLVVAQAGARGETPALPQPRDSALQSGLPVATTAWRDAGYGAVFALIGTTAFSSWTHGAWLWVNEVGRAPVAPIPLWVGGVLSGAVLLWLVSRLPDVRAQHSGARRALMLLALVPALAALLAPGLAAALVVLLLGRAAMARVLTGLGVLFLLGWLALYYYSLSATLLEKSLLMIVTGVALVAMRLFVLQRWPAPRGVENHDA